VTTDYAQLVQYIANVGFPAVIALLFWRHIDKVERAETEAMNRLAAEVRRLARINHVPRRR